MKALSAITAAALAFLASASLASAQDAQDGRFRVSSTTFENGTVMPLITINNIEANGVNACSIDGAPGGDESPELSWANAPHGTRSFAVTAFDVTAGFAHWRMYDIHLCRSHRTSPERRCDGKHVRQAGHQLLRLRRHRRRPRLRRAVPSRRLSAQRPPLRLHGLRARRGPPVAFNGGFPAGPPSRSSRRWFRRDRRATSWRARASRASTRPRRPNSAFNRGSRCGRMVSAF